LGPLDDILGYMKKCGGQCRDWYVGIAEDPQDCLFKRYSVNRLADAWIYRDAINDNNARAIESVFTSNGYDGGPGGGSNRSRFVYAFKKTTLTRR
jgi:hypothetical protein